MAVSALAADAVLRQSRTAEFSAGAVLVRREMPLVRCPFSGRPIALLPPRGDDRFFRRF